MITNYKEYANKMNILKNKLSLMNNELIDSLKNDIVKEFSKHLQLTKITDIQIFSEYEVKRNNMFLFLLDADYGIIIKVKEKLLTNATSIEVRTTYIINNTGNGKFNQGALVIEYKPDGKISFDEFVDKCITKLKKLNETRKLNKEKREIKKLSNKYNL